MSENPNSEPTQDRHEDPRAEQPDPGEPVADSEGGGTPEGGEGRTNADHTPRIGDEDQTKGETAHRAPEDEIGVPDDEERDKN